MTTTTKRRVKPRKPPLSMWGVLKKTIADSAQSESGNIDPARLQYIFVAACGIVFIWGTVYDTLQNHRFNGTQFAIGAAGLATLFMGVAGGVRVKNPTELPLAQQGGIQPIVPPVGPMGATDDSGNS